jgi:hypothetical protein
MPLSKNPSAHSDDIAPSSQSSLKITRHPHTENQLPLFSPHTPPQHLILLQKTLQRIPRPLQPFKIFIRLSIRLVRLGQRPDGHQTLQLQPRTRREDVSSQLRECVLRRTRGIGMTRSGGSQRGEAGFGVFVGGVDLEKDVERCEAVCR